MPSEDSTRVSIYVRLCLPRVRFRKHSDAEQSQSEARSLQSLQKSTFAHVTCKHEATIKQLERRLGALEGNGQSQ